MGVNSEKEPVEGTSPDKLLFERSLFEIYGIVSYKKRKRKLINKEKINITYRTWRAVMLVKDFGIEPERLLLLSRLHKFSKVKMLFSIYLLQH